MIHFSENSGRNNFYPLTLLQGTEELFCGLLTNTERWGIASRLFSIPDIKGIPPQLIPLFSFWPKLLQQGQVAMENNEVDVIFINRPWNLLEANEKIIRADIELLKLDRPFVPVPNHVRVTGSPDAVFIEAGAVLEQVTLNTTSGPIYISKDALIMDGAMLRGPIGIRERAVIKMGAAIYSGTSIGQQAIVGGEVKNSIIGPYSNKGHEGYLGDSILGRWCNLGAGSSVSNLKNTGTDVEVWNMGQSCFESAGLKCGIIMGDFTRTSINCSLTTGSVTGICCHVIQQGTLLPKVIPNFTWLHHGVETYRLEKAISDISKWMGFKNEIPEKAMIEQLISIFNSEHL